MLMRLNPAAYSLHGDSCPTFQSSSCSLLFYHFWWVLWDQALHDGPIGVLLVVPEVKLWCMWKLYFSFDTLFVGPHLPIVDGKAEIICCISRVETQGTYRMVLYTAYLSCDNLIESILHTSYFLWNLFRPCFDMGFSIFFMWERCHQF